MEATKTDCDRANTSRQSGKHKPKTGFFLRLKMSLKTIILKITTHFLSTFTKSFFIITTEVAFSLLCLFVYLSDWQQDYIITTEQMVNVFYLALFISKKIMQRS